LYRYNTAEGNEKGLTISFRGLDNRTYYMVAANGEFYNYSGCGNTLNCNHPVVRQMIMDSLTHWVTEYHIDGFRFDLASIMTRASAEWDTDNMVRLVVGGCGATLFSTMLFCAATKNTVQF
jgi:isoamylase